MSHFSCVSLNPHNYFLFTEPELHKMAETSQPVQESAGLDGGILEPIAVVGMSMKFPQDAVTEESFWQMLLEKRCAATEFPEDRLNIDAFHSPEAGKRNTVRLRSYLTMIKC